MRKPKITCSEYVDKVLNTKTNIIYRAKRLIPSHLAIDELITEFKRRANKVFLSETHLLIVKDSRLLMV